MSLISGLSKEDEGLGFKVQIIVNKPAVLKHGANYQDNEVQLIRTINSVTLSRPFLPATSNRKNFAVFNTFLNCDIEKQQD